MRISQFGHGAIFGLGVGVVLQRHHLTQEILWPAVGLTLFVLACHLVMRRLNASLAMTHDPALLEAVVEFLDAEEAVDAEARRAEQIGASAWSSAGIVRRIYAVDALRAALVAASPGAQP